MPTICSVGLLRRARWRSAARKRQDRASRKSRSMRRSISSSTSAISLKARLNVSLRASIAARHRRYEAHQDLPLFQGRPRQYRRHGRADLTHHHQAVHPQGSTTMKRSSTSAPATFQRTGTVTIVWRNQPRPRDGSVASVERVASSINKWISVLNVGYQEAGPSNGPVAILLHGSPCAFHAFAWRRKAGYRVIIPYLRTWHDALPLRRDAARRRARGHGRRHHRADGQAQEGGHRQFRLGRAHRRAVAVHAPRRCSHTL